MQRGDIVLAVFPASADAPGREQVGTRPALVVHNDATSDALPVVMIVPFTSSPRADAFACTLVVEPTAANGLSLPSVLLVFQLRAIDKRRISHVIGHLDAKTMGRVDRELLDLLGLPSV